MATPWGERLQPSTRKQLLELLRRRARTVSELAQALQVSGNAVRVHLSALERDGLAVQRGVVRKVGKPAYIYELTPEGEKLFPKPYVTVLNLLLSVLEDKLGEGEVGEVMSEVGRRAAAAVNGHREGTVRERAEHAMDVVGQLGGMSEIEERPEGLRVQGHRCPLVEIVPDHPEACRLAETLLSEVIGAPLKEVCQKGASPRCAFQILQSEAAES